MSKADKMFEKLGYVKFHEPDDTAIEYTRYSTIEATRRICFWEDRKNFSCWSNLSISMPITMPELQAINEKVKELGWLDE